MTFQALTRLSDYRCNGWENKIAASKCRVIDGWALSWTTKQYLDPGPSRSSSCSRCSTDTSLLVSFLVLINFSLRTSSNCVTGRSSTFNQVRRILTRPGLNEQGLGKRRWGHSNAAVCTNHSPIGNETKRNKNGRASGLV